MRNVLGNLRFKSATSLVVIPTLAFASFQFNAIRSIMTKTDFIVPQAAPSWNYTTEELLKQTHEAIDSSNELLDSLEAISNPSVENFVMPYLHHENTISPLFNQLTFLQHVSSDKELRDTSTKVTERIENFGIESSLRFKLFSQFDIVWNQLKDDAQFKKDHFEIYKFVEKCHKDFLRSGLNLPEEQRDKVKEIKKKISNNSLQFSKNLGEQNEFITFTKEELNGVSENVMKQFETVDEDGVTKYKVTFKYPDIFPVLKSAKNAEIRKRAFIGDQNKVPQNEALFLETLQLRNDLAELLNYDSYADYNLDIKMAKKEEAVLTFLNDLKSKLKPLGEKELTKLKNLKEEECEELNTPYDGRYYIWDNRYYDNQYLKKNFQIDEEKIAEYFPLESTIKGMLQIYETVLKLKFIEEDNGDTWHPDVKKLSVWKMDGNFPSFVGWIYFDLHPREGKYGHAANFGISSSFLKSDGSRSYPVTALVCNFSKPTKDKPALLKHSELTTFFHELGHGIHDLVGGNEIGRFNGPSATPWDFVEAPSQMLEFWTWNKKELKSLSKHYQTEEKIPDSLLDSLVRTKHINGALFALRQLHFGLFDMKVHTTKDISKLNVTELWNSLREEICLIDNGDIQTKGFNSFGHIMSDSYSAGYYGYMWADVFASDMYYTKFLEDPLNSDVGVQYRDIILARGGLYEIEDNLTEFLGRKPNNKAFLKELGL
ncbi:Prd1 [Kluyveromyces lactis]|nr:Prd1 [Kluyveromyces lactis]